MLLWHHIRTMLNVKKHNNMYQCTSRCFDVDKAMALLQPCYDTLIMLADAADAAAERYFTLMLPIYAPLPLRH